MRSTPSHSTAPMAHTHPPHTGGDIAHRHAAKGPAIFSPPSGAAGDKVGLSGHMPGGKGRGVEYADLGPKGVAGRGPLAEMPAGALPAGGGAGGDKASRSPADIKEAYGGSPPAGKAEAPMNPPPGGAGGGRASGSTPADSPAGEGQKGGGDAMKAIGQMLSSLQSSNPKMFASLIEQLQQLTSGQAPASAGAGTTAAQ